MILAFLNFGSSRLIRPNTAGFFVLDFLKGVRLAKSHHLDLLMREFFGYAHSGTANKTQYTQMVIMRVFWGMAMVPDACWMP